jgi:hypothetical protein
MSDEKLIKRFFGVPTPVENLAEASGTLATRVESATEASGTLATRVESSAETSGTLSTRVETSAETSGTLATRVESSAETLGMFFHDSGLCPQKIDNPLLCVRKAPPNAPHMFYKLLTVSNSQWGYRFMLVRVMAHQLATMGMVKKSGVHGFLLVQFIG